MTDRARAAVAKRAIAERVRSVKRLRRKSQEQRAGVIDRLLNETNKQGEKTEVEGTPVKEVAPAK